MNESDMDEGVVRGPCPKCGALVDRLPEYLGLGAFEVGGDEACHTPTLCSVRLELAAVTRERDALRAEVEGDNGLRASKEAGWALAQSRLRRLEKDDLETLEWEVFAATRYNEGYEAGLRRASEVCGVAYKEYDARTPATATSCAQLMTAGRLRDEISALAAPAKGAT